MAIEKVNRLRVKLPCGTVVHELSAERYSRAGTVLSIGDAYRCSVSGKQIPHKPTGEMYNPRKKNLASI